MNIWLHWCRLVYLERDGQHATAATPLDRQLVSCSAPNPLLNVENASILALFPDVNLTQARWVLKQEVNRYKSRSKVSKAV